MQHECARQLKDGTGWHWVGTHTADCRVRGCEPHATRDAAEQCQHEHELSQAREVTFSGSAHECVECKTQGRREVWSNKALQMGGYMGRAVTLCDEHRTVDVLRKHTEPPSQRWVS